MYHIFYEKDYNMIIQYNYFLFSFFAISKDTGNHPIIYEANRDWGCKIRRSKIFDSNKGCLVRDGVLRIHCEVIVQQKNDKIIDLTRKRPRIDNLKLFIDEIKSLVWNNEETDIILKTKTSTFRAHKKVLNGKCFFSKKIFLILSNNF